jgi:hypothetical protein
MGFARENIRKMQRELKNKADKDSAKRMGWPKALRQYASRFAQGAESAEALSKQVERNK